MVPELATKFVDLLASRVEGTYSTCDGVKPSLGLKDSPGPPQEQAHRGFNGKVGREFAQLQRGWHPRRSGAGRRSQRSNPNQVAERRWAWSCIKACTTPRMWPLPTTPTTRLHPFTALLRFSDHARYCPNHPCPRIVSMQALSVTRPLALSLASGPCDIFLTFARYCSSLELPSCSGSLVQHQISLTISRSWISGCSNDGNRLLSSPNIADSASSDFRACRRHFNDFTAAWWAPNTKAQA